MPRLYRNHQPQIPKELERLQVSAHPSMKAAGEYTPPSFAKTRNRADCLEEGGFEANL